VLIPALAECQDFANIRVVGEGGQLIVLYDLVSPKAATYTVALYSSHNNFSSPVLNAKGDVGKGQKPGINKRIAWDAATEMPSFKGDIIVELGGQVDVVKLGLNTSVPQKGLKKGKKAIINWQGGTLHPTVKIELLKDGRVASSLGEQKNTGVYEWKVPKDFDSGSNFQFRISAGEENVQTTPFAIKSGLPLWLKIAVPAAAVGTTLAIIIFGGEDDLPEAPGPG